MPITNPTEVYFKDGGWAWDGSRWRKQPLLIGYSEKYDERKSNTSAAAGTNSLVGTAVPAGEVWVVQGLGAVNINTACSKIHIRVDNGSTYCILVEDASPVAGNSVLWSGSILLAEGDKVTATFYTCVLNDDIYLDIWGFKMSITE